MESLMAVCFKDLPEDQVGPKGDELLIADDHGLQDIDRHLPKALRSDVKACAQCGVTKTPQWREGPHGPKTLCNACGVKRVRQMKSLSDSSKRRASRGQPPSFREDSNEAVQQSELRNEPQLRYNHRPSRQGVARPGLLVDLQQDGNDAAEPDHFAVRRSLSSNSDASYHQCDNVEEETCGTGRPEHVPLKSPMSAMVGSECAAAVNLLSMTVREGALPLNTLDEHIAKQGSNTSFAQTASTSLKQTISSFSDFGQTHDFIMQNVHFLPLEKQREWNTVKGQMDTILQQSAAANAAVAAVAKVLAMKQAEAMEARQQANARAQYLRPIMQQIKEECMSSHNKRRRT